MNRTAYLYPSDILSRVGHFASACVWSSIRLLGCDGGVYKRWGLREYVHAGGVAMGKGG
jgi:hypothetical protein